jgi:two-component system C4-dicarboxylate transport response regulator DctD
LLIGHFAQGAAIRYQRPVPQWTAQQMASWQMRDWPGNVRELRNFVDRLVLGIPDPTSFPDTVPVDAVNGSLPLPVQVDMYERNLIADALKSADGNVAAAAERLGIPKKTLYDKIKKAQLSEKSLNTDQG